MPRVCSVRRSWRLPVALVTAVVVARGRRAPDASARPRTRAASRSSARAYFSEAQIEQARGLPHRPAAGSTSPRRRSGSACWSLIVRRPPRRLAELRAGRCWPAPRSAAAISRRDRRSPRCRSSAVARERAKDVGLVTQDWVGYARRRGQVRRRSARCSRRVGGALLVVRPAPLRARAGGSPGAAVVVAFGAITTYAGPVVLDPLFNDFKPLPRGELRSDVLALAREAGVDVGEVYEMDASRRTTAANAYVTGLGRDQARRALRQPRRRTSRRPRRGSSSPTSSATCTTTTCATG